MKTNVGLLKDSGILSKSLMWKAININSKTYKFSAMSLLVAAASIAYDIREG